MVKGELMQYSRLLICRGFFQEIVLPILQREFPAETAQTAFGLFGLGSEAFLQDDEYSRDHHWGIRIDALMPEELFQTRREVILQEIQTHLPAQVRGYSLRAGR